VLQLGIAVPDNVVVAQNMTMGWLPWVAIIVGAYLVIFAALLALRYFLRKQHRETKGFKKIVLLVTVPKEAPDVGAQGNKEATIAEIREKIGVAESLFAAVGGLSPEKGIKAWLIGREDEVSFEMVMHEGLIHFYVAMPEKLRGFVEEQIHANYPHADIEDAEDYNIFMPTGAISGAWMVFKRATYFPIKTYQKQDIDPLSNITNALATIAVPDGAAIQLVMRAAPSKWRKLAVKIASNMQQGKSLAEATRKAKGGFGEFVRQLTVKSKGHDQPDKERKLTPLEEEMVKGLEEKAAKSGLEMNIRIVASANTQEAADKHVSDILNAWSQLNSYQYGNSFQKVMPTFKDTFIKLFIYRGFDERKKIILNSEEAASVYHFPGPWISTPNIHWLAARHAAPPVNMPKDGLVLGYNEYRGIETVVKIKRPDRRRHVYVIGRSGVGKTEEMVTMAIQDVQNGEGVCIVDPHGDFVESVLQHVPPERADDVIVFDPSDTKRPVGLNMLEASSPDQVDMAVQEMIAIFYELFPPEMIGPAFEHNMRNVMLTLMADFEHTGTIAEIPRMFSDKEFADSWVKKVKDPVVRSFWEKEMAKTSDFHKSEMLGYLISKVGRFVENEMMRNIIGQNKSGFNFREVMDKKKILLVNLSKGKTGDVNAKLLGLIIVSKLTMAALSRADVPEDERNDFYLYIDEFQNFITDSISTILSEARKYKLNLIIAHQYMGQLAPKGDTKIRDAVLGNAGTIMSFRIGIEDAQILEKEFAPVFNAYDLVNVDKFTAYVKLLIENTGSKPFNMHAYPPKKGNKELAAAIKQLSRLKYGRDKTIVEMEIMERSQLGAPSRIPPMPPSVVK
jgi:type IV secretory pathway TraG/TraD family ATPase VirD4